MNITPFPGTQAGTAARASSPSPDATPAAEPPPPTDWPAWIERTVSRCPKPGQALIAAWADLMGSLVSGLDPALVPATAKIVEFIRRQVSELDTGMALDWLRKMRALCESMIPALRAALIDPDVFEVTLNPDGALRAARIGAGNPVIGTVSRPNALAIINAVAEGVDSTVHKDDPSIEGSFPIDGSRFIGIIPPTVPRPTFALRKKAVKIFTLEDYVAQGILSEAQQGEIVAAVKASQNILVCGGTASGKSTLTNAILDCIAREFPADRVVTIEDVPELQISVEDLVQLLTSAPTKDGRGGRNMQQLLKATLRLTPKSIVVGEVRDGAANDLLMAWNTGHPGGVATVHANSTRDALVRIEQLIALNDLKPQPAIIAAAINRVVFITRTQDGRRVEEVAAVRGWSPDSGYVVERLA